MRRWSEARTSSAPLNCALKVEPRESKRSARSSPAVGFQSAGKTGTRSASCGANRPAMNSAAMNGTRSAVSVVREIAGGAGLNAQTRGQFGRTLQACTTRELQIGELQDEVAVVAASLPLTVK